MIEIPSPQPAPVQRKYSVVYQGANEMAHLEVAGVYEDSSATVVTVKIPAPEGAQADERSAFEDAASEDGTLMSLENPWARNARGDYDNAFVQTAWKFWLARAAHGIPAPKEPKA